jgi:SOS response associated peptidase (SRAP)
MCARYTLHAPPDPIAEMFGLSEPPRLDPRYNVGPSQFVPVVGAKPDGRRGLSLFRWGFVPSWSDANLKVRPVNAKAETVDSTPMFGDSFRKRRCLVPADGFYEWRTVGKRKMPVHFPAEGRSAVRVRRRLGLLEGRGQAPVHGCDPDHGAERVDPDGARPDAGHTAAVGVRDVTQPGRGRLVGFAPAAGPVPARRNGSARG